MEVELIHLSLNTLAESPVVITVKTRGIDVDVLEGAMSVYLEWKDDWGVLQKAWPGDLGSTKGTLMDVAVAIAVGGGQLSSTVVIAVISITHGPKGHLDEGVS